MITPDWSALEPRLGEGTLDIAAIALTAQMFEFMRASITASDVLARVAKAISETMAK